MDHWKVFFRISGVDSERAGVGDIEDAGTEMRGLALRRIERSRTVPQPPQNLSLVPLYDLALLPTCGRERRWRGKVEKEMTPLVAER